jgi:ribosomal-protein-alanine N-acetyltransferase
VEYDSQQGIGLGMTQTAKDDVIGLFGLHYWEPYHRRAETDYGLAHAYWGQGIASEAHHVSLHFGFEWMNLNRIYARTIADNHESRRLPASLGFQREGTQRQHSWQGDGTFHDSAISGLLASEFAS